MMFSKFLVGFKHVFGRFLVGFLAGVWHIVGSCLEGFCFFCRFLAGV